MMSDTSQATPATGLSDQQIERAMHNLGAFRQPLTIVATANGHVTEGVLTGVFVEDLETVIAAAREFHRLRAAALAVLDLWDDLGLAPGYTDKDGGPTMPVMAALRAALHPAREAPLSVGGLARWAETHGDRLIATADAYHALRAAVLAMDDGSFLREEFPDDRVLCVDLDDMLTVRAVIERTAI